MADRRMRPSSTRELTGPIEERTVAIWTRRGDAPRIHDRCCGDDALNSSFPERASVAFDWVDAIAVSRGVRAVRTDRLTLAAYAANVVIAGSIPVAVRLGGLELPLFWAAGLRFGLAAIGFAFIALVQRAPFPRGRNLAGSAHLRNAVLRGRHPVLLMLGFSVVPRRLRRLRSRCCPWGRCCSGRQSGSRR